MPAEEKYWRDQVASARHGQLEMVRKAATGWSALFGGLLGIFGTAAFAGGLPTLDDLPETLRQWLIVATIAAAVLIFLALVLAGIAAGPNPRRVWHSDWKSERKFQTTAAERASDLLKRSRIAGALAVFVVVAGSVAILIVGKEDAAPKPTPMVAVVDGRAVCGPLASDLSGGLAIGEVSLVGVASLIQVDSCP